ncbi:Phospholipase A2 [Akanthomyces lecanii RCEF 1005]|uniref:Phospholipase A2 n=1 Tax=Akanthomyces lecanii RCEF 1005 TaxID=1081108 RepID=A0A162J5N4_CORDF|nr:Phospholipase A2 [Akanthomyces lecanii RCEF 1005]
MHALQLPVSLALLAAIPSMVLGITTSQACTQKTNGDNCARAVTGTRLGAAFQSSARADCSSFLEQTATASTVFVTNTVTTTSILNANTATIITVQKRADPTKTVPAYASACSGSARYASACSGWCITASTTTVTPMATVTSTVTVNQCARSTETVCNAACVDLQTDSQNCGTCGNTSNVQQWRMYR